MRKYLLSNRTKRKVKSEPSIKQNNTKKVKSKPCFLSSIGFINFFFCFYFWTNQNGYFLIDSLVEFWMYLDLGDKARRRGLDINQDDLGDQNNG